MITKLIKGNINEEFEAFVKQNETTIDQVLNALEWHWVNGNNPMSVPYWTDKIGTALSDIIYVLSETGAVTSYANARRKWGEFYINQAWVDKHITREEQTAYKTQIRIKKYAMRNKVNPATTLVKTPKGIQETGLIREGFALCANREFKLDTAPLVKYYDAVLSNLTKSMDKVMKKYPSLKLDSTNYAVISKELLDYYIFHSDNAYTMEGNVSDSRGRAIYNALKRVGNPIACKDIRACMVVPQPLYLTKDNTKAMKEIYLFIAELSGQKHCKSWGQKMLAGKQAYLRKDLHTIDLTTEDGRKELHENIWLERIYNYLDILEEQGSILWDIPIEIDATMSLAQVVGTLTNDVRLLNRTNVINADELLDAWFVEGVPRLHTKTVGTPVFYGSSQSAVSLLRGKKLTAIQKLHEKCIAEDKQATAQELKEAKASDKEVIKTLNKEFNKGAFGIIKGFKDFLIQHSNVDTPIIPMKIWSDKFNVNINKFKPVRATINAYTVWNSASKRDVTFVNHDVETVPDYDRFRLYYPTGLV